MIAWAYTWRVFFWTVIGPYWAIIWFVVNCQAGGTRWSRFNILPPIPRS